MLHPRRIVPLTLTTLLACQVDPVADPTTTDTESDTGTDTTDTSSTEIPDPTTGAAPTSSTGDTTTDTTTTGDTTDDSSTTDDPSTSDTTDATDTTDTTTGEPDPFCGDGRQDDDEQCDHGQGNGDDQACTAECTINVCGDGKQGPGEGCDDGNALDGDACSSQCSLPSCGDGLVADGEPCDDGDDDDTDECTSACTAAVCGDGFAQPGNGETCDDGADNNDAAACTLACASAACGDGLVYPAKEECDDGPANGDGQACTAACLLNVCGDGDAGPDEACDDGNALDGDGCSAACEAPPDATTLTLKFTAIKRFDFTWAPAAGATHYRLLERPTANDPFTQIGGDILEEKFSATMPLHLRFGARYVLQACNAAGCTAAPPLDVVQHMAGAVGYFKASNAEANDEFARFSLSADGKTLAVGGVAEDSAATGIDGNQADNSAPLAGAVYVFVEVDGVWSQQAYIKASNTSAMDTFGAFSALSADGDVLAVGASGEDSAATGIDGDQTSNAASGSGAVYIFERVGQTWAQKHYIKASNAEAGDGFARVALSGDGDTLAVSAVGEDSAAAGVGGDQASNSASSSGAAYVFVRTQDTWTQQAYIKASNPDPSDNFGGGLALSADGTTLAVSATGEDSAATGIGGDQASNAATSAGAVYLFRRSDQTWSQQAYIKTSNAEANDLFGQSVTLSANGNTLAAGAHGEDGAGGIDGDQASNATNGAGAVFVFTFANDAWSQQAYLKAPSPSPSAGFGVNVSLAASGDLLAVATPNDHSGAIGVGGNMANDLAPFSGAVYVLVRAQGGWSHRAYVKPSNTQAGSDQFSSSGIQLSADGRILAVANSLEDGGSTGIGGNQANQSASASGALFMY